MYRKVLNLDVSDVKLKSVYPAKPAETNFKHGLLPIFYCKKAINCTQNVYYLTLSANYCQKYDKACQTCFASRLVAEIKQSPAYPDSRLRAEPNSSKLYSISATNLLVQLLVDKSKHNQMRTQMAMVLQSISDRVCCLNC